MEATRNLWADAPDAGARTSFYRAWLTQRKAPAPRRVQALAAQHAAAGVTGLVAQLLFDADQLVIFGKPVRSRQRAGFDLPGVGGNRDVGDGGILGLPRAVRDHGVVASALRHTDGVQ